MITEHPMDRLWQLSMEKKFSFSVGRDARTGMWDGTVNQEMLFMEHSSLCSLVESIEDYLKNWRVSI